MNNVVAFDMEFMEDGSVILPISIGAVRSDGRTFYEVFVHDSTKANDWVKTNVLPLVDGYPVRGKQNIADMFREFCGERPEFWADYGSYDWVCLCQMYGTMMDLPNGWPMFVRDAQQAGIFVPPSKLPHHALRDAEALMTGLRLAGLVKGNH